MFNVNAQPVHQVILLLKYKSIQMLSCQGFILIESAIFFEQSMVTKTKSILFDPLG